MFAYVLIALAALAAPSLGNLKGAPNAACVDMVPQHGVSPQSSVAPYKVLVSKSDIKSSESITVTIKGNTPTDTIKGFLLQGREGTTPTGSFVPEGHSHLLNCGTPDSSVTHTAFTDKPDSLSFSWAAPRGFSGKVVFRATVALNGGEFWVGIESAPINIVA